jgi:hypothetical protein
MSARKLLTLIEQWYFKLEKREGNELAEMAMDDELSWLVSKTWI